MGQLSEPAQVDKGKSAGWRSRVDLASVAAFLVPFVLVLYLGLERGGFAQQVWSEVGIVAWWALALGLLAGALRAAHVGRIGWIALGLLAAYAVWTAIGVSWSDSAGRSVIEGARTLAYVGVFALALLAAGRERARLVLGGVASAIAVIAALALLSRLHPSWFPENKIPEVLTGLEGRLAYPLGYWNALAGLIALAMPLVAWGALAARSVAVRALAGAAFPVMALASYYTFSRGGLVASAAALLVLIALWPRRLTLVLPGLVLAGGVAALIWQASRRPSLADGLTTSTAEAQGDAMLLIVAVVALVAAASFAALALLEREGRLPRVPTVPRRAAGGGLAALVLVGVVAFIALGGPDRASDAFDDFKQPGGVGRDASRLTSAVGNGRWQYWSAATDAASENPLTGIGPGTFVFYWAENRDVDNGFVRDAHSLFLESLGELGIIGLVLIGGFVLVVVGTGVSRCATAASTAERRMMAAATASAGAFAVAAGVDWLWELAAIPIAFLLVAATIVVRPGAEREPARRVAWPPAIGGAAVAAIAIAAIAIPMVSHERLRESQESFREGDLETALERAEGAQELAPFDAAPRMQEAFVYEAMSPPQLVRAAAAAREATERESTNWETWYVLSRIEAQRDGREEAAVRALRRARELDPFNPVLAGG